MEMTVLIIWKEIQQCLYYEKNSNVSIYFNLNATSCTPSTTAEDISFYALIFYNGKIMEDIIGVFNRFCLFLSILFKRNNVFWCVIIQEMVFSFKSS